MSKLGDPRETGHSGESLSPLGSAALLAALFAAAACAIIYELLIGSISSYFLGDSIEQFSLTIGFFLFAMGIGSWISRLVRHRLIERFISLEIWLGLIGGLSAPLLYVAYGYTDQYRYSMLLLIVCIGSLIGLELPLMTRILRAGEGSLRTTLSSALSLDYLGSLVAALLFPYVLLPFLGTFHTSLAAGLINVTIAIAVLICLRPTLGSPATWRLSVQSLFAAGILVATLIWSSPLRERWESDLYSDRIVYSERSEYQQITMTQWRDDIRLFLDGHLQFASVDEYRYHEALVHPAMAAAADRGRVLMIGGGDGLAVREVLKYPDVEAVDLVDLDGAVTDLGRRDFRLTRLNENSLNRPRVRVINEDAFLFIQRAHPAYGVIIVDLPDPRTDSLAKLYSVEGYRMFRRHLAPGGALVTQATSPYFATKTYWSIAASLREAGFEVVPYHVLVPSFGDWGFHLAAVRKGIAHRFDSADFSVARRFLRSEQLAHMRSFSTDTAPVVVEANRLDRPIIIQYYADDWDRW